MILEINQDNPEPRKIRRAVDALEAGEVILYPTDTCYGLGCDPLNKKAVDRLYQVKGIDRSHLLSFVCQDLGQASKYAVISDAVYRTLKTFLPGPYCFILRATHEVPRMVQTPRKTVGVRIPKHAVAQALAAELGRPLVSSTAAQHGEAPNPDPREIELIFPGVSMVLDAGAGGTVPTSVIDLTEPEPSVVRQGAGDVAPFMG